MNKLEKKVKQKKKRILTFEIFYNSTNISEVIESVLGAATNDVNVELCAREYFNKHIIDNPSIEWKFEFVDGTTQKDYMIPT